MLTMWFYTSRVERHRQLQRRQLRPLRRRLRPPQLVQRLPPHLLLHQLQGPLRRQGLARQRGLARHRRRDPRTVVDESVIGDHVHL